MLTEERHRYILTTLKRDGKVLASELSQQFDVSPDTIRRDLRKLAEAGLLRRVHGGALPSSPAVAAYSARQQQSRSAKNSIAQAAVQLIHEGQVIILDGGTTLLEMAQRLPFQLKATMITHSPPIAAALADYPNLEVIVVGGRLVKESLVVVGAATVETFRSVRADLCLLGVCSLHPEAGISTTHLEEAHVKQAMIASSAEVAALASAEKLGTATTYTVGPLSELTYLVTEANVTDELLAPYQAQGLTIIRD